MVNVLFCGNAGVFDGMLTCALSMMMRTGSKEPFRFFVFTMDLSSIKENYIPLKESQIEVFRKTIQKYNPENEVAKKLYASFGFVENGEMDEDEIVAVLKL